MGKNCIQTTKFVIYLLSNIEGFIAEFGYQNY